MMMRTTRSYLQRFPDCVEIVSKRRKSGGSAAIAVDVDAELPSVDPQMLLEIVAEADTY